MGEIFLAQFRLGLQACKLLQMKGLHLACMWHSWKVHAIHKHLYGVHRLAASSVPQLLQLGAAAKPQKKRENF